MLVKTVSFSLGYLLLIFFNGCLLINADKGGANIVVQGKSDGHGGGGSVVVNSPKKGPQNIVIRDYRGTVVLNSHKKGGANIVVSSHEEKKPDHHHKEPHHDHGHHGHHLHGHLIESPKMMPMLGESGSVSGRGASKSVFGARSVKPYESEELGEEEQLEPTPTISRKRKGTTSKLAAKKKLKTKVVREQNEEIEEQPRIRGRTKGDSETETEAEPSDTTESDSSSDAYSPSNAEEDPYSGYREGPGPLPQTDRKGLRDLEKGVEYGVEAQVEQQIEQQIEQGLLGQVSDDESSDPNSPSSSSSGSGSASSSGSTGTDISSLESLGLTGSDIGSDSPGYFASAFPSSDPFNTDSLKGLTLSDALFGSSDKDSSGSGLLDLPWTRRSDNSATFNKFLPSKQ